MNVPAPPGWYPDPTRAHQFRYFDGRGWTDHVSDNGVATQAPLGPTPIGLVEWHPPAVMVQSAYAAPQLVRIPRVKMWIFAVLSLFVFWVDTPGVHVAIPFGILFAFSCWQITKEPLRSRQAVDAPGVSEITVARWIAVAFAILSTSQAVSWMWW